MFDIDHKIFMNRIIRLAEILQLEERDLRNDYSGRGMCGDRCFGITHHSFSEACHAAGVVGLPSPCTDSMGLNYIVYWEDFCFSDDDYDKLIDSLESPEDFRFELMPILNKNNDGNADLTGWHGIIDNVCGGIVAYGMNDEIANEIARFLNHQS